MIASRIVRIFRRGSRTYFYSSLFFPAAVRQDVFRLYAFVRLADDFVDRLPQDRAGLDEFEGRYRRALEGAPSGDVVVDGFVDLSRRRRFDPEWIDAFFSAMRADLSVSEYRSIAEVEAYMYGSAEVIGLMMSRILGLPDAALPSARLLGKAMQYVNFLRDVAEDAALGRRYVPLDTLQAFGLEGVTRRDADANPAAFAAMVRSELRRYRHWAWHAKDGFAYLPPRARVAIQTASDMYDWTADVVDRDPTVVFRRKVRPPVALVLVRLAANAAGAVISSRPRALESRLGRLRTILG